jgi:hypothetical protein
MSEYKVSFTNVPVLFTQREEYEGVFIHISPPVPNLNSDAIERYLTHGDFEPVERKALTDDIPDNDIRDVVVLGSTDEQTTIYASVDTSIGGVAENAAKSAVEFLQFMGAQAVMEQVPEPDTSN